jgi:multidrug resistance efflux pump
MAVQLPTRGSLDAESDMLPQDPPPWIIRGVARLLIGMFFVGLIAASVVHLPETVECKFVLVPEKGADPIQSPRQAVVSQVGVTEGQSVQTGAELFILQSDEIRGLDTQAYSFAQDLHTKREGLGKNDLAYLSQLEIKKAEIAQAESEVKFRENHARTLHSLVGRMEKLSASGGISEVELIRLRLELAASEKDHSVSQRTLQQVNLERERLDTEHSRVREQEVSEIEKLKFKVAALKTDLASSQQNMLSVRAPYDGVVVSLSQRNVGSVVQIGQELCQLARENAKPRARLAVNESGLQKLTVGQSVKFFLDAFPYQRYGAVSAKLDWISPSVVSSPDGPHFVALASLDETAHQGQRKPLTLRVGMTGVARIVVGRRTMVEYAFEPIRQLRENMRE